MLGDAYTAAGALRTRGRGLRREDPLMRHSLSIVLLLACSLMAPSVECPADSASETHLGSSAIRRTLGAQAGRAASRRDRGSPNWSVCGCSMISCSSVDLSSRCLPGRALHGRPDDDSATRKRRKELQSGQSAEWRGCVIRVRSLRGEGRHSRRGKPVVETAAPQRSIETPELPRAPSWVRSPVIKRSSEGAWSRVAHVPRARA